LLRRLWTRLLRAVAARMRRWADALNRDADPAAGPPGVETRMPSQPPAHWLERVRRDAPQLLTPPAAEGSPPRIFAQPPEPRQPRGERTSRPSHEHRDPVDAFEPAPEWPVLEEPTPAADRPASTRTAETRAPEFTQSPAPSRPASNDVRFRPIRNPETDAPDPARRTSRSVVPESADADAKEPQRPEEPETTPTSAPPIRAVARPRPPAVLARRPIVVAVTPDVADASDPVAIDRDVMPSAAADARFAARLKAGSDRKAERASRAPEITAARSQPEPPRTGARMPETTERPAPASVRWTAAPWPRHDPYDPPVPPTGSAPENRWPELPPDMPSATPDWTEMLSRLRRARALEEEQQGGV
jgi:hypothetical protein